MWSDSSSKIGGLLNEVGVDFGGEEEAESGCKFAGSAEEERD